MSDTPKTDSEAMWAESGTGGDFQCVHIDDAREMERLLIRAKEVLTIYANNDLMGCGGDEMIESINKYLGMK